jgi:hypothetical protein
MTNQATDSRLAGWPKFNDFPQTEAGWNHFCNQWVGRRRITAGIGQIPQWAIEDYRAANGLAVRMGWQESAVN